MLLVLIYSRSKSGEEWGEARDGESLVHPDLRVGVQRVPSDEGTFTQWDQGSSLLIAVSTSLGMDAFSGSQRETCRSNSSWEGDIACLGDNLDTGQQVQCPHHSWCSSA